MTETALALERTTEAPRHARRHVRGLVPSERADDAVLLVSELVTNAVKYGPENEHIDLLVARGEDRVRLTVHDRGRGPLPEMREPDDRAPGGHGLRLVDALADRWGVERGSTRVWFEIDC